MPASPRAAVSPSRAALNGVLVGERADALQHEHELGVERLLHPQGSVVVEDGDALGLGHEIARAFCSDRGDEFGDGLLRRTVLPGRERVRRHGHRGPK